MGVFQQIGIVGRPRTEKIADTLEVLINFLSKEGVGCLVDEALKDLTSRNFAGTFQSPEEMALSVDLFIVLGGDGSLLQLAPLAAKKNIPVVGINKGKLGFLTDITPPALESALKAVFSGLYIEERRFLIAAQIKSAKGVLDNTIESALNDVVLLPGDIAHMIEFEIYVDNAFMCRQRADGLIVATPTGSTAYALSGGGPILHPQLDAIVLVPMFPHTLSNRPIVLDGNCLVEIKVCTENEVHPWLSSDGKQKHAIELGGSIELRQSQSRLRLIHPNGYQYFETLRTKLGWR